MPTEEERFIYDIALEFRQPKLCQKIGPYAEGRDWWGGMTPAPAGYQITYLQSDCYLFLASVLRDNSLCDKVRPVRRGVKDGSQITPDFCRADPESPFSLPPGGVPNPYTVVAMMEKIGYDEQAIREFQYSSHYSGPIHDAYDRLLKEDRLAEHVKAAPTFDEPAESAKERPANDLEYLYEMVANDTNDSFSCEKISPNAISDRPTSRGYPLRFSCYSNIALNKMDTTECGKLPMHARLHSEEREFNLAENCMRWVQDMHRVPNANRGGYGPEFPPTFASFKRSLHDVGYDLALPEPTYSDYEDFVLFLAYHADPSARKEFIERVNAMKLS